MNEKAEMRFIFHEKEHGALGGNVAEQFP